VRTYLTERREKGKFDSEEFEKFDNRKVHSDKERKNERGKSKNQYIEGIYFYS
jgi:hypothetical protein